MMRHFVIVLLLLTLPMMVVGQKRHKKAADKQTAEWRYEIESQTVGLSGSVVVKVWSYSKKPNVAQEQAKKNAVHGVIFKGIPAKDRVPGKRPLVANPQVESEHQEFFKPFFENGGDYMKYVTLTNSGAVDGGDVMKISKKEYKVGVIVTVSYDELRKMLEAKGIIKGLDSGF